MLVSSIEFRYILAFIEIWVTASDKHKKKKNGYKENIGGKESADENMKNKGKKFRTFNGTWTYLIMDGERITKIVWIPLESLASAAPAECFPHFVNKRRMEIRVRQAKLAFRIHNILAPVTWHRCARVNNVNYIAFHLPFACWLAYTPCIDHRHSTHRWQAAPFVCSHSSPL